ncbi:DUF6146 family protein [Aquimarina aquimarini]|uniref:DUF6146 family protein n=1 Tax=Aquimarina aquimarini TaxID=1191734 RepID=UPI000D554BCB|nr:DUF6146 family protein [Aquimarina aquimarini]
MKNLIYILFIGIVFYSCTTTKNRNIHTTSRNTKSDTIRIANDSLEYEILIIEPGFNSWIVTQRPRGFYSERFLETRNNLYVTQYNQRVLQPLRFDPNLYVQQINYDSFTHYGYEVNYLLYNYFLYFEQRYKQRFIVSRRGSF